MKNLKLLNIVSALLALITIILMFIPFWTFTEDGVESSATISQFIWTPSSYKTLQKELKTAFDVKDLNLNTPALSVAASLFFAAFSIFSLLKNLNGTSGSAVCLVLGFSNIWGFIRVPMLHMASWWIAFPIIGVILIALNVSGVIAQIRSSHAKALSAYTT